MAKMNEEKKEENEGRKFGKKMKRYKVKEGRKKEKVKKEGRKECKRE